MPTWSEDDLLAAPPHLVRPAIVPAPTTDYGEGTIESAATSAAHTRDNSTSPLVVPTAPIGPTNEYREDLIEPIGHARPAHSTGLYTTDPSTSLTVQPVEPGPNALAAHTHESDAIHRTESHIQINTIKMRFNTHHMSYLQNIFFNQTRHEGYALPDMRVILKTLTPNHPYFLPVKIALRGVSRELKFYVREKDVGEGMWKELAGLVEGMEQVRCMMVKDRAEIGCVLVSSLAPPRYEGEFEAELKFKPKRTPCKLVANAMRWLRKKGGADVEGGERMREATREPSVPEHRESNRVEEPRAAVVRTRSGPVLQMRGGQGHGRMDLGCFDTVSRVIFGLSSSNSARTASSFNAGTSSSRNAGLSREWSAAVVGPSGRM